MNKREGYMLAGLLVLVIIVFVGAFAIWGNQNAAKAIATEQAWMTQQAD